jgi:uncharacterized alkaline shock family protein YloU
MRVLVEVKVVGRVPVGGPGAGGIIARRSGGPRPSHQRRIVSLSESTVPGGLVITPTAVADVVRSAALGSYGVTGLRSRGPFGGRLPWPGGRRAIVVDIGPDRLDIGIWITVAYGSPVAEVARQVDSAVRFAVRRAIEREVGRLAIHVGELRVEPAAEPPSRPTDRPAESATDEGMT